MGRIELPFRMRNFAAGHSSVVYDIPLRPGLINYFAGKCEGVGGRQEPSCAALFGADGSDHMIKMPGFGLHVISSTAGLDVLVTDPALEQHMAFCVDFSGVGVIGCFVRP